MASTAQDPSAPLRAEKKDEDRDEDSARLIGRPQHCLWLKGCSLYPEGPREPVRRQSNTCSSSVVPHRQFSSHALRGLARSGVLSLLRD